LLLIFNLTLNRPTAVLSTEGMFYTAAGARKWFIRWQDIELIKVYADGKENKLGIVPRDLAALSAHFGRSARKEMQAAFAAGRPPLSIGESQLPITVADLADRIEKLFGAKVERAASVVGPHVTSLDQAAIPIVD
jgi:hypothetical protein